MQQKGRGWFLTVVTALILVWVVSTAQAEGAGASETNVAVVNGSAITQEEFEREMTRVEQMLLSRGRHLSAPELVKVKRQVLEDLISRELLYQESQKKGIKVEESAVDEELRRLKEQFPNETEFRSALDQAKLSETAVKHQIRQEMAIKQLVDEQFGDKLTVSDKESKAYYDNHTNLFKKPEQVRASHILIKVDPQGNESQKAEARKRIEEIQEKLRQGEEFEALAGQYSECPSAASGGDLKYFRRGQMVKPFEAVAFTLKPGDVSEIVETRFGYHLIKVTDKKPEETVAYEDVNEKIKEYLRREKTQGEMIPYVERLEKGAEVQRLMKADP
jgi:peptidyl-prolyl cis-trans isomerase C